MPGDREKITTVDLLRHGACEGGEIYRGHTDVPLTSAGWQQMELAVQSVEGWQRIVSSPLSRCSRFAEHCATSRSVPLHVVTGMREMDFGEWEGRLLKDVWREDPELVSRYYEDPGAVTPPGGEATADALQRVVAAWQALLHAGGGEHVLLVSHGGVIRLLLSHLLQMPLSAIASLHIPYASLTRVRVFHRDTGDFPVLMHLNSTGEFS